MKPKGETSEFPDLDSLTILVFNLGFMLPQCHRTSSSHGHLHRKAHVVCWKLLTLDAFREYPAQDFTLGRKGIDHCHYLLLRANLGGIINLQEVPVFLLRILAGMSRSSGYIGSGGSSSTEHHRQCARRC